MWDITINFIYILSESHSLPDIIELRFVVAYTQPINMFNFIFLLDLRSQEKTLIVLLYKPPIYDFSPLTLLVLWNTTIYLLKANKHTSSLMLGFDTIIS